jgi:hypothetical protein
LVGWLVGELVSCLFVGWLSGLFWLVCCFVGWLVECLFGWLVVCLLVDWLFGLFLVGWLLCRLVGWLVGW